MAGIRNQTSEEHEYLEKLHYEQLQHSIQNAVNTVSEEQFGATSQFCYHIKETMHHAGRMKNILVCFFWEKKIRDAHKFVMAVTGGKN